MRYNPARGRLAPISLSPVALLFLLGACREQSDPGANWAASRDSVGYRALVSAGPPCGQCIAQIPVALLGDTAGPGAVGEEAIKVVADGLGRYWVSQNHSIAVFDTSGRFIARVGREGDGPLEFRGLARPLRIDKSGQIHVVDGSRRETAIGPAFTYLGASHAAGIPTDLVELPGRSEFAVSMWLATPANVGQPIHLIADTNVIRSFGMAAEQGTVATPFNSLRVIAADSWGQVLAAHPYEYRIEGWDTLGTRVAGYEGPALNDNAVRPGEFAPDNPPPNKIHAIQMDDQDHLWILRWRRRRDWQSKMVERRDEAGSLGLAMKDPAESYQTMFTSEVDVVDLRRAVIVATEVTNDMLLGFLGKGVAFGQRYRPDGTLQVAVIRLTLRQGGKQ